MTLAIENVEKAGSPHIKYVLENIKSPNLKILFDVGHAHYFTNDVSEFFNRHKDRIVYTHLHDNDRSSDAHNSLGNGNIDYKRFFKLTKSSSIEYHILEVNPRGMGDVEKFRAHVRNNVELLKEYLK